METHDRAGRIALCIRECPFAGRGRSQADNRPQESLLFGRGKALRKLTCTQVVTAARSSACDGEKQRGHHPARVVRPAWPPPQYPGTSLRNTAGKQRRYWLKRGTYLTPHRVAWKGTLAAASGAVVVVAPTQVLRACGSHVVEFTPSFKLWRWPLMLDRLRFLHLHMLPV